MKHPKVAMLGLSCATLVLYIVMSSSFEVPSEPDFVNVDEPPPRILRSSVSKVSMMAHKYSEPGLQYDESYGEVCATGDPTDRELYAIISHEMSSYEQQPSREQRSLSSSVSELSIMALMKNRYHGTNLQSGEDGAGVCEDVDQMTRKLYAMLDLTVPHKQVEQRILSSSVSKLSIMAKMKSGNRYSGSDMQVDGLDFGVCKEEAVEALYRNLKDSIANDHESRHLVSKTSIMATMKSGNRYSGSGMQEAHQLVACSISKADSVITDYYKVCEIDRCCALEKYVTDFIHQALAYTRYCSLYSDNLNENGTISVFSNFSGPFLEPGLPLGMADYGAGLQEAMTHCQSCSTSGNESLLNELEDVLEQWSEVSLFLIIWYSL